MAVFDGALGAQLISTYSLENKICHKSVSPFFFVDFEIEWISIFIDLWGTISHFIQNSILIFQTLSKNMIFAEFLNLFSNPPIFSKYKNKFSKFLVVPT